MESHFNSNLEKNLPIHLSSKIEPNNPKDKLIFIQGPFNSSLENKLTNTVVFKNSSKT